MVEKVGYIILSIFGTSGLTSLFIGKVTMDFNTILGMVVTALAIISSGAFLFKSLLAYYGYESASSVVKTKNNKLNNLKRWKKLNDEDVIKTETYDKLRKIILKNEGSSSVSSKLNEMLELIENHVALEVDLIDLLETL